VSTGGARVTRVDGSPIPPGGGLPAGVSEAQARAWETAHPINAGESLEHAMARYGLPGGSKKQQNKIDKAGGKTSKANDARIAASQARIRNTNNDTPARPTQNSSRAASARKAQTQ
jgi:hypothetical protein